MRPQCLPDLDKNLAEAAAGLLGGAVRPQLGLEPAPVTLLLRHHSDHGQSGAGFGPARCTIVSLVIGESDRSKQAQC